MWSRLPGAGSNTTSHGPLAHKDIRLALATGRNEGVPLPSASLADEMFTQATELGYGHRDVAALFEVLGPLGAKKGDA